MSETAKPALGDRVEVLEDLKTGSGRVYLHKGSTGVVVDVADPETLSEDEVPLGVQFGEFHEEYMDFADVKVVTPAAEVSKEPRKYEIEGTIKVEVEVTIEANSYEEAQQLFESEALELLSDNDSIQVKKTKIHFIEAKDRY